MLKKHAATWEISTDHFLPGGRPPATRRPLSDLLVEHSPIRGTKLKERLYREGLKSRRCEMCGQGEEWRDGRMALILDHVNGVRDDNRLENLRVLCPNCNATLDTHCGRKKRVVREPRACERCGDEFTPNADAQRFCSRYCGSRHDRRTGGPRKVERPSLDALTRIVERRGYSGAGRELGVSDNAIRKWFRAYGVEPPPARGRELNPPPVPAGVLTDEEARRALAMLADGASMYAVARSLGVSRSTIADLRRGLTYRHIQRPEPLADAA